MLTFDDTDGQSGAKDNLLGDDYYALPAGAELNISSLALTAGQTQSINFISISQPG